MGNSFVLNNLQERNNLLQSKLIHDQLKYGTYHFGYFKKYLSVISEYKKLKSFFKVSSVLNISQKEMINWYIEGQMGNTKFRSFYLAIDGINRGIADFDKNDVEVEEETAFENIPDFDGNDVEVEEEILSENIPNEEKDYIISQYGDGWSYKTFIGGEKIFIIANELKTLKEKVKAKHLPLD